LTEIVTKIKHATVFRDGARVTRSGKVTLETGPQKVLARGITELAQRDSFRVSGHGPASLASIDVGTYTVLREAGSDVKPILDEIERLEKERQSILDEMELHKTRLANVGQMMTQFAGTFGMVFAAGEGQVSQLGEIDKSYAKIQNDSQTKLRELTEKLREVDDKLAVARRNLGAIQAERTSETFYEVQVNLDVREKSEVELGITYQVAGASWVPKYDVDLRAGIAKLRRMAVIGNRTREPWEKVTLVVSTASARPVSAVEPTPFVVREYIPVPEARPPPGRPTIGGGMPMKLEKARPMAMAPAEAPSPPPPPKPAMVVELATASETSSGISVYELPKPMTIPFDDDSHPVTLVEEDLETRTVHYWYTDAMAEVVAQDEVTNGENVLLAGTMKVYSEGDYIGETSIPLVAPREKFKLGARVAYDVKAKKKLVEREVEKAGLTRGKLRRFYAYRLEIENFSKRPIQIKVVDRVPHSLNPAIEVKMDSQKLGLEKFELGVMEWLRSIEPSKKDVTEYSFEVFWEKGITISPPLP